jgi:hypothetical protein
VPDNYKSFPLLRGRPEDPQAVTNLIPSYAQSGNVKKISGSIFLWVSGTGVSPVQAQAKAYGYKKYLHDCNSISNSPQGHAEQSEASRMFKRLRSFASFRMT